MNNSLKRALLLLPRVATLTVLAGVLVAGSSRPAQAYETGYHFYMTYVMGYWCGLDAMPARSAGGAPLSEAYAIAAADYSVDLYAESDAGAYPDEWLDPEKTVTRRMFHFAVPRGTDEKVVRASPSAMETIDLALNNAAAGKVSPVLLGIGMHTLQDSFAHEGFGPRFGHWHIEPDLPYEDVPKAIEAARLTWTVLDNWRRLNHGHGCRMQFSDISGLLGTWVSVRTGNAQQVAQEWAQNAAAVAQKSVQMMNLLDDPAWQKEFTSSVAEVVKMKSLVN